MNQNKLIQNIIDQIKEAQIKLGYVKETVRLYYPTASINALLGINAENTEVLLEFLKKESALGNTELGNLQFSVHQGRIEISIPPEGAEYVNRKVPTPAFLSDIIALFGMHHNCSRKDICAVFEKYSPDYICEEMPEGMDFDYVLHFKDETIDAYYYCIKEEMGHTIYHRFTKEDYNYIIHAD